MSDRSAVHEETTRAGAVFSEHAGWLVPAHYGNAAAEYQFTRDHASVFDQCSRDKVQVAGQDAQRFLHNLCTNDILHLAQGQGCEAFFTTAQARVVAHAWIYHVAEAKNGNSFWLDAVPGIGDKLIKHLDRFIISEQVELTDRTRDFAQFHVAGPDAGKILSVTLGLDLKEWKPLEHRLVEIELQVRRHEPLNLPGFDFLCPVDQATEIWRKLIAAGARPAGQEAFNVLRIEAGTPEYGIDIDDNRFVVEVNRTAQAICYTKGCYLGQEPIVMARDRGQVNRLLLGLRFSDKVPVAGGTKLLCDGTEVGVVTSSAFSPQAGTAIGLAYIRRGHQSAGTVFQVADAPDSHTAVVVH